MANSQTLRQWLLVRTIAAEAEPITIKRLIEITGANDRTIRRDICDLKQAGFPIVETTGEFGRKTFSIAVSELPSLSFTYDEALALKLCQEAMTPLAGTFFWASAENAFRKIESLFGRPVRKYLQAMLGHIRHTGVAGKHAEKAEILDQITMGLEESKAVFVTYHSQRSTEPVTLDLHPLGIVEHRGAVYVIGFSPDHNEIRTWKLDRILAAEKTNFPFLRPDNFNLEGFLSGSLGVYHGREEVIVRVRFSPSAARYISEKRLHASQQVTLQRDGSAIAVWKLSSTVEIRAAILSFGSAAEVLEPAHLREEVRAEVEKLAAIYSQSSNNLPSDAHSKQSRLKVIKRK